MKIRFRGFALGLLVGFLAISVVGMVVTRNLALEGTYTYLRLFNEALSLVRNSYVDEVETDSLMRGAYEGLVAQLDPFSEYLTAEQYAALVEAETAPGADLADVGIRVAKKRDVVVVISVRSGSDAEARGVSWGDRIRRIDDRSVREMSRQQVESRLAGPEGSTVTISFTRRVEAEKVDLDLVRRRAKPGVVSLDPVDGAGDLAVLRVPDFAAGVTEQMDKALRSAGKRGFHRLLIDVRGNAWGGLGEAAKAAGLFLGDSAVAELKSRDGRTRQIRSEGHPAFEGMAAVLMDGSTAEAAELFAAALRDSFSAALMGEKSFGVGAEQEIIPLKNGGYLQLSVRKYFSPSGTAWHGKGLEPDVEIEVSGSGLRTEERRAEQLKQAIEKLRNLESPPRAADAGRPGSARRHEET